MRRPGTRCRTVSGRRGTALWEAICGDLPDDAEFDARELHFLRRACRIEDELSLLEAAVDAAGPLTVGSQGQVVVHPAIPESRQLRLTQLRLLGALSLDPDAGLPAGRSAASVHAHRAARARWGEPAGEVA